MGNEEYIKILQSINNEYLKEITKTTIIESSKPSVFYDFNEEPLNKKQRVHIRIMNKHLYFNRIDELKLVDIKNNIEKKINMAMRLWELNNKSIKDCEKNSIVFLYEICNYSVNIHHIKNNEIENFV